jgi:hypothetical protein
VFLESGGAFPVTEGKRGLDPPWGQFGCVPNVPLVVPEQSSNA